MANIATELSNIKNAVLGKDVRSSIHDGIYAINKEVESTTQKQSDLNDKQDELNQQFKNLVINAGNSNAEVAASRGSYDYLPDRLNAVDEQFNTVVKENELIKSKFVDVTVEQFGAKGNANYFDLVTKKWYVDSNFTILATDDSIPFQNAINYVLENGGGRIKFKAKNYYVKNTSYINPSRSGIPIELVGIKSQSANADVYSSNNFIGGTNIITDVDICFSINRKSDGNQNLGVESAEFDCFYASGLRFIGMYQGDKLVNGHTVPTFNYPIGFKIVGTRYKIEDCSGYGVNSVIHQDLSLPNGKYNYSDFVSVKRISSRWCNDVVVKATRCDVSIFEKIHNEMATENMHSVLNVVGGTNVNIKCISSSMNDNFNITPISESGVVRINSCDCVNLENVYCERNTNWSGVVSAIESTNVKCVNVGEHSFDNINKTNPIIYAKGSDVDINGLHSRGYRKDTEPDIKCELGENSKMCRIVLDGVDIKEGTYTNGFTIRKARISDFRAIEGLRNRDFKFIDIKYENEKWNVYRDGVVTDEFGTPTWSSGSLKFQMQTGIELPKLLRMRKIVLPVTNSAYEMGYIPVINAEELTLFSISFYDGSLRKLNLDSRFCCRVQFI